MAKGGTFENKKVHKHLHLWPLGHHRRKLAVRSGTSKGSKISQYGCSTFGALATEAQYKEQEEEEHFCEFSSVRNTLSVGAIYCWKYIYIAECEFIFR